MGKCLLCALVCTHKCTRALREDKRGRGKSKTEHVGVWVCECREREGGRTRTRKRGGGGERENTRDRGCGRKKVNTHKTARDTKSKPLLHSFQTLQHDCSTLQRTAAHCSSLQNIGLQHSATHYNHTKTHCNTATHCNTLQHTATHYNTLQHCNTLQHTATHYNTPAPYSFQRLFQATTKDILFRIPQQHSIYPPALPQPSVSPLLKPYVHVHVE